MCPTAAAASASPSAAAAGAAACASPPLPAVYGTSPPAPPPPTKNHSSGSLNSSFIWREANPNNFNVYSASVASLNSAYSRYSPQMPPHQQHQQQPPHYHHHQQQQYQPYQAATHVADSPTLPHSTANTPRKTSLYHQLKQKTASNYEAMHLTPLLPVRSSRHNKPTIVAGAPGSAGTKMWRQTSMAQPSTVATASSSSTSSAAAMGGNQPHQPRQRSDSPTPEPSSSAALFCGAGPTTPLLVGHHFVRVGGLYDRRVNRSFEAPPPPELKLGPLRRSTPHLAADDVMAGGGGGGAKTGAAGGGAAADGSTARHSATWCCGNFVLKQWRKMHNYD